MLRIKPFLSLVALVWLTGCPEQPKTAAGLGVFDRVVANYHGLALDAAGKSIPIDYAAAIASIDAINREMGRPGAAQANDVARLDQAIARLAAGGKLADDDRLRLRGLRAQILVEANPAWAKSGRSASFALLRTAVQTRLATKAGSTAGGARPFAQLGLIEAAIPEKFLRLIPDWFPKLRLRLAYCSGIGVPQPPDWGTAGWVRRAVGGVNTVPQNRLYILDDPALSTEVWTHTDPGGNGGCIALPRRGGGGTTLGVICQNASTGKACFWDNRPHPGGAAFSDADMAGPKKSIINDWVNGNDAALIGGGKCVQCHRGENAFVLHADTLLSNDPAMPFDTDAAVWYTMINSLGWTNPPKTAFAAGGGCTACHDVGSTTVEAANYCSIVRKAAEREMPDPATPAGWNPAAGSAYKAHIDAMKANGC